METDQLKELKRLEKQNEGLRKAVSEQALDKLILAKAAKEKFLRPARRQACIDQVGNELGVAEQSA